MFLLERHQTADTALLVCIDFGESSYRDKVHEFVQLVQSAGLTPLEVITAKRLRPDPAYFVGRGKMEEIAEIARVCHAPPVILFNHTLSPAQERNLERTLHCRVCDRTTLILDIFAQRAKTAEGKLQVELAQLTHLQTRLIRGWTHLERQQGGIGVRGPGETQLETDRRLIGKRIARLKAQLITVKKQRETQRRARKRRGIFTLSLVGYTNSGKSTLFNRLTQSNTHTANQLFATLDTISRQLFLSPSHRAIVSDTVGFIQNLPHTLIAAFRATLEETVEADLLLHVADITHPSKEQHRQAVNTVLSEIGADAMQLIVWNKIDCIPTPPAIERDEYGNICAVSLSAKYALGIDLLRTALIDMMNTASPQQSDSYEAH